MQKINLYVDLFSVIEINIKVNSVVNEELDQHLLLPHSSESVHATQVLMIYQINALVDVD